MEKFGFINLARGLRHLWVATSLLFLVSSCTQNTPMPVPKKFFSIKGTVTDQAGRPLGGVSVAIVEGTASWPEIAALTNENGQFGLGSLENGTYTVQAMYSDRTERAQAVIRDADASVKLMFKDQ